MDLRAPRRGHAGRAGGLRNGVAACLIAAAGVVSRASWGGGPTAAGEAADFRERFEVEVSDLASTGRNPFLVLEPGYRLTLEGQEDGKQVTLVVSVLEATERVDGVETRVVEEKESVAGSVVEVSRNFFAISRTAGDVYYFGEDVDIYRAGKLVGHEGAWRSGVAGARFGLMMPGKPATGARFYQEVAPKVAMDRCELVGTAERVTTPAGTFEGCLKFEETTPLEPDAKEYKYYAPGVGLVRDGPLALVRRAPASKSKRVPNVTLLNAAQARSQHVPP